MEEERCPQIQESQEAKATAEAGETKENVNPERNQGQLGGKYTIIRPLGQGAEGSVFLARDEHLQRLVAVKRVREPGDDFEGDTKQDGKGREGQGQTETGQSMREAGFLQQLEHPMLPIVYDLLREERGVLYLVMEYIQGVTLRKYIEREGFVQEARARIWAEQLADVLHYLHTRKPPVIYSDLKPDNIMVCPDGRLRLIDFGAAVIKSFGADRNTVLAVTPGFGAPEQWGRGDTVMGYPPGGRCAGAGAYADERSDLYAFGMVLYYSVTGADPAKPPYATLPVYEYQPLLGDWIEAFIRKCICREPESRYQTIEAVQKELAMDRKRRRRMRRKSFVRVIEKRVWLTEGENGSNYSAQDFALAAKSVRTCRLSQEGICPSPQAALNVRGTFVQR